MIAIRHVSFFTPLFSFPSQTRDPGIHLTKIMSKLESEIHLLGDSISSLARNSAVDPLDCNMLFRSIPPVAIYNLAGSPDDVKHICSLSRLFRSLVNVDWLTNCLATCIRIACQKANEFGFITGHDHEWKKVIDSKSFESLVNR